MNILRYTVTSMLNHAWTCLPRTLITFGIVVILGGTHLAHTIAEYLTLFAYFFAAHSTIPFFEYVTDRLLGEQQGVNPDAKNKRSSSTPKHDVL